MSEPSPNLAPNHSESHGQSKPPVRVVLIIAGSDSSGGAGIQADMKAAAAFGVHAATAITAVTAQNSEAVEAVFTLEPEQVRAQIRAVANSLRIDAVKLGMLANADIARVVAEELEHLQTTHVIMDPVLYATSGGSLFSGDTAGLLVDNLLPKVSLLTPNLDEAAQLLGEDPATDHETMQRQAQALLQLGPQAVLLKGGHFAGELATDYLATAGEVRPFSSPRLSAQHTHGSGCTLATAIAAALAQGLSLKQAVAAAKTHIQGAIANAERLGLVKTNGPVHSLYQYW
jgi:hydroxymethylpyrimidine/phosphomethylpyrimidine kinase